VPRRNTTDAGRPNDRHVAFHVDKRQNATPWDPRRLRTLAELSDAREQQSRGC
jgi:hypothetical protein